jgi:hypothetical protein
MLSYSSEESRKLMTRYLGLRIATEGPQIVF